MHLRKAHPARQAITELCAYASTEVHHQLPYCVAYKKIKPANDGLLAQIQMTMAPIGMYGHRLPGDVLFNGHWTDNPARLWV